MRVLILTMALLALAGIAHAGPLDDPTNAEARRHYDLGFKAYNVGEFDLAIEEYKAGALIEPVPVFLYNLGQTYRQLGKYTDAIWYYQRFIATPGLDEDSRHTIEALIAKMQAEQQRAAMTAPPTEALSGAPTDTLPTAVPITDAPRDVAAPWYADPLGWGVAGAGVVGLAVGGGFLISANGLIDQSNLEDRQLERIALRDKADSRRTVGTVIGLAGVGATITGAVLLALHPSHTPIDRDAIAVIVGPRSFGVAGRF